jgi:hypothetical protein
LYALVFSLQCFAQNLKESVIQGVREEERIQPGSACDAQMECWRLYSFRMGIQIVLMLCVGHQEEGQRGAKRVPHEICIFG